MHVIVDPDYAQFVGGNDFEVDVRMAEITRRRLMTKLISAYNLDKYYSKIEGKTARSVWKHLSSEEVSLLKRLCAVKVNEIMS